MPIIFDGYNYASSGILPIAAKHDFTLMCWAYLDTTSEMGNFFCIGREDGTTNNGYQFGVGTSNLSTLGNNLIASFNGVGAIDGKYLIGTGWHHCAFTNKDEDANRDSIFYIDGIEHVFGNSGTAIAPTLGWAAGARLTTATNAVDNKLTAGNKVAQIKIFDRRLVQGEVITEMNSFRPVFVENLKAWIPMDEGTGTSLADYQSHTYKDYLNMTSGTALIWISGPPISHD